MALSIKNEKAESLAKELARETGFKESERDDFAGAISDAGVRLVSSVNAFEASIVILSRKGRHGLRELDLLLHAAHFEIVPFTSDQLMLVREAYERFGKGRHPAGLNFGACCAYALSKHSGQPLLFKGEDFPQTDVTPAIGV